MNEISKIILKLDDKSRAEEIRNIRSQTVFNIGKSASVGAEYIGAEYSHIVDDISAELSQVVDKLTDAKVSRRQIALDPGIGFGKSVDQNLALLKNLDVLKKRLNLPFVLGTSRKSFIGRILDLPIEERLEGTAATVAAGIMQGADIIRVHDVREMVRVARVIDRLKVVPPSGKVGG